MDGVSRGSDRESTEISVSDVLEAFTIMTGIIVSNGISRHVLGGFSDIASEYV